MTMTDPFTLLILSFIVLFGFLLIGIPIAISLGLVGVLGLIFFMVMPVLQSFFLFEHWTVSF